MSSSERPFFTPGFDPALALMHATRIRSFTAPAGLYPAATTHDAIVSDTGQLTWRTGGKRNGFVTIQTDKSQGLIGFIGRATEPLQNIATGVDNEFCAIILAALDDKPISQADRLLLVATARSANTGMKWNDKRTSLTDWGTEPSLIEPVRGFITLRNLSAAKNIEAVPLDSGGKPLGASIPAQSTPDGYRIPIGEPVTPWYLVRVVR
jgi:hypothetical protein